MFHAPTTETKQNDTSRGQSTPERTRELSPRVPTTIGRASAGASAGAATPGEKRCRHPLARLHSAYGNQAILRMLSRTRSVIQTKLTVNQPGDQYEQEADRAADQIMRMTDPLHIQRKCSSCGGEEELHRKCEDCEKEEKSTALHRKDTSAGPQIAPPIVHHVLSSPGQALAPAVRAFMEPRFGLDFSGVRIHDGSQAAESASAVSARAYTVGQHIVFGSRQYSPESNPGQRLLAHELAHVVQQRQGGNGLGRDPAMVQRAPSPGTQAPTCSPASQPVRQLPTDFSTPDNVQALAEIMWHEMANKAPESTAVGSIVVNRLLSTKFHRVSQLKSFERKADPPQSQLDLACSLLTGELADTTNGSWYYFSPQSMPDESNPGCCSGQSGPCSNTNLANSECGGGLQVVPGTNPPRKVFFPKFAKGKNPQAQPQGTDPMLILVYLQ